MKPHVLIEPPPNFEVLDALFDLKGKKILYAWRDRIYNPSGIIIPDYLLDHEAVHCGRQGASEDDTERWWSMYVADHTFRFAEEILAHRQEWKSFQKGHRDRNLRARYLHAISQRLASSLYGSMVPFAQAKRLIQGEEYKPEVFKL